MRVIGVPLRELDAAGPGDGSTRGAGRCGRRPGGGPYRAAAAVCGVVSYCTLLSTSGEEGPRTIAGESSLRYRELTSDGHDPSSPSPRPLPRLGQSGQGPKTSAPVARPGPRHQPCAHDSRRHQRRSAQGPRRNPHVTARTGWSAHPAAVPARRAAVGAGRAPRGRRRSAVHRSPGRRPAVPARPRAAPAAGSADR